MTQTIEKEQIVINEFKKLSPEKQQEVIDFIQFLQVKEMQKQETLEDNEGEKQISFLEAAKDIIGCIGEGPGDLATNKKYLEGLGR